MKISMVSEHASPLATLGGVDAGGQNVHVAALSAALADRGHEVTVYTRRDNKYLPERVDLCPGVSVVNVDAGPAQHIPKDDLLPYIGELGDRLTEYWQADSPDIVHSHFWMSGVAALKAARSEQRDDPIPVVHTFHALGTVKRRHQGSEDTSPAERAELEPMVGKTVDGIVATCSDEAFELKSMGIPAKRISVVPCGVDLSLFTPNGKSEQPGPRRRILTVGRLVPRKGVELVISALALLLAEGRDDVELMIVGGSRTADDIDEDPDAMRLLKHAQRLGVADHTVFRGQIKQTDLPAVMRSAHMVVCAPWYEPFGIVPLEAMATGTPVVAAAVGGLIDSVVDGVTGIHVPPRDVEAIAAAIGRLLDDRALLDALGAAGYHRTKRRYSWPRVAAQTERVYRSILARSEVESTARQGAVSL